MPRGHCSEKAQAIQANRRGLTPEEWHDRKVEIMEMAWDSGIPYKMIARRFRVAESTVSHLARYGPSTLYRMEGKRPSFTERTPEDRKRHAQGMAIARAAKIHGVSREEWLAMRAEVLYRLSAGETPKALALEYGIPRRVIHNWAYKAKRGRYA